MTTINQSASSNITKPKQLITIPNVVKKNSPSLINRYGRLAAAVGVLLGLSLLTTETAYETWFSANKGIIDRLKKMGPPGPALGAIQGMVLLEPHKIVRSGWYEHIRFTEPPKTYGFDVAKKDHNHRPVLLLPGAIGTWNYLADLASALKQKEIPVFVMSPGAGGPTQEKLQKVREKILEIRSLYKNPPLVDIVAHSMGANLGVAVAYDESSLMIDSEGNITFQTDQPNANPFVGKVITLANPLVKEEVEPLQKAKKIDQFFNILAKYDGIMGHKQPGLVGELAQQSAEVKAGHIGIVFDPQAHQCVIDKLTS